MQTAIVLLILGIAIGYVGLRFYRSVTARGGCGCGCEGCRSKKKSSCAPSA